MKALTLTQPWATLVAIGAKKFETRSWGTAYRGLIAIHSAKAFPKECQALCIQQPFQSALDNRDPIDLPLGFIIAVGEITDCWRVTDELPEVPGKECHFVYYDYPRGVTLTKTVERMEFYFGDFSKGRYVLALSNVQQLAKPIPCRGALGLWTVPEDVLIHLPKRKHE